MVQKSANLNTNFRW